MKDRPWNRVPVEIWEHILFEVIAFDSIYVSGTSCTSSNYFAFKLTCGNAGSTGYREQCQRRENYLLKLRCVCRAWKAFVDRSSVGSSWILAPTLWVERDHKKWRDVLRLDYSGHGAMADWSSTKTDNSMGLSAWLVQWNQMKKSCGAVKVKRMELLYLRQEFYPNFMTGLCDVAPLLRNLRSLALTIPNEEYPTMEKLADHFPNLTHLTLSMPLNIRDWPGGFSRYERLGPLKLNQLEVLFLFPNGRPIDLSTWWLPSLRHIHIRLGVSAWASTYAFLKHHAANIETIDLEIDEFRSMGWGPSEKPFVLPSDFWNAFVHLRLLRCNWCLFKFETLPRQQHILETFAVADSIGKAAELVDILQTWVGDLGIKHLKTLVLHGSYLSSGNYLLDFQVRALTLQLRSRGTRLVGPSGELWS